MARPKDPSKEIALLDAALRLIMQHGLTGLKMTDLAKSAGVAIGTTYLYFQDKRQLLSALYEHVQKHGAELSMDGYDPRAPVEVCVRHIWMRYMHRALERTQDVVFLEQYRRSPYLDATVVKESEKAFDPIRQLMKRGIKQGEIKDLHVELMIQQLSAAINRFAIIHKGGLLKMSKARIEEAYRMAWDSIRA
jgi:AcrR family transcriptional regulator